MWLVTVRRVRVKVSTVIIRVKVIRVRVRVSTVSQVVGYWGYIRSNPPALFCILGISSSQRAQTFVST
jgi:hypothetical protein